MHHKGVPPWSFWFPLPFRDVEEVMGEKIEIAVKRMVLKRDHKKVIERFETEVSFYGTVLPAPCMHGVELV